jgi:UDP-N-acetylmuramoyl-tripeptide--D-alanyl-D-alanine ligase
LARVALRPSPRDVGPEHAELELDGVERLGAMYELGARSIELHEELGRLAVALASAHLVVVTKGDGSSIASAARAAGAIVDEAATAEEAERFVRAALRSGDVVWIKASNSVGLGGLGRALAT